MPSSTAIPTHYAQPLIPASDVFRPDIFKGKVLFCTGGRGGIIYGMVEEMMKLGCDVAIFGRNTAGVASSADKLTSSYPGTCLATSGDVRKPSDLAAAVKQVIDRFGRIDFVICGAAGNFLAPMSGLSENAFKTVVDIDLLGTYNTIKATLPHLRESKGGYIHISATLHYRGFPWQAHVSAAKAGVDALSQVLAVEEGPRGVRSNVIAPGLIAGTEGADRLVPRVAGRKPTDDTPLGRAGDKTDVANMAVFLFSDAAKWITGHVFVVDGGEQHTKMPGLPYPQSVLDPKSVEAMIKARM